ncbi:hypothetical protein LINPERHAP1_LOCUS13015, partial [Linum perenne]
MLFVAASILHNKQGRKPIKIQQFHYTDLEAATNGFSEVFRSWHGVAVWTTGLHNLSKIHSPGLGRKIRVALQLAKAIPLLKKRKLSLIYDPRIPLLKDPLIKKQLVLIASKC